MNSDIVTPKNNESEFMEVASKLGFKKLYFLYEQNEFIEDKIRKKLETIKENYNVNFEIGFILKNKNTNISKSNLTVAKSSDKDRFFIEIGFEFIR